MIDYKIAFQEGLNEAEEAELAKKEIDSVFQEVSQQINEASGGSLQIIRRSFKEESQEAISYNVFTPFTRYKRPKRHYMAIAAINLKLPNHVEKLAEWTIGKKGYPCKLIWDAEEQSCLDKEALELALSDLLKDPQTGKKLQTLMNLNPDSQESDDTLANESS